MAIKTKSDEAQLKFRVDQDLRERLEMSAEIKGTSLNKDIIDRLRRSFTDSEPAIIEGQKATLGILKALEVAMEASGESALFTRTHSWDIAKEMNWINDGFAYDQAVATAMKMLEAFRPKEMADEPVKWNMNDGIFWAEFFLKQIASGKPNVPENAPLIDALRNHLGELVDRVSELATIDPDDRARARFLENSKEGGK